MNFQLKCRNHADCGDAIKAVIGEKVTRFEPLVPEQAYLEIELIHFTKSHRDGDKEAEVILDIPGVKPVIRFAAEGETYIEAVDRVLDKLDEELSDLKARSHEHNGHHKVPVKVLVADEANSEEL